MHIPVNFSNAFHSGARRFERERLWRRPSRLFWAFVASGVMWAAIVWFGLAIAP